MTIRIKKNQANNCVFTLQEKTTILNPKYLLELKSKQDDNHALFRLTGDTSSNIDRYNQFEFSLADSNTLSAGEYTYYIWQSTLNDLDTDSAISIVESGLFLVIGTGSTAYTYSENPTEYTVKY